MFSFLLKSLSWFNLCSKTHNRGSCDRGFDGDLSDIVQLFEEIVVLTANNRFPIQQPKCLSNGQFNLLLFVSLAPLKLVKFYELEMQLLTRHRNEKVIKSAGPRLSLEFRKISEENDFKITING